MTTLKRLHLDVARYVTFNKQADRMLIVWLAVAEKRQIENAIEMFQ